MTSPTTRERRRFGPVALLWALLAFPLLPLADTRADEEPAGPPSIVSKDVLELMGLSPEHAWVFGIRLPMTAYRFFDGQPLQAVGDLLVSAFEQNIGEFEEEMRDIPIDNTAIALALTLDPGGARDGWEILDNGRLMLDEVTFLLCLDGDRGMVLGIAGALVVGGKRLAVAMTIHREPTDKLSRVIKEAKEKLIANAKAKAKAAPGAAVGKVKNVLWPMPPPPETNATVGGSQGYDDPVAGVPGERYDGRLQRPMGPKPNPKKKPRAQDVILTLVARWDTEFSLGDFRALMRSWDLPTPLDGALSDDALVLERLVLGFEIDISARRMNAVSLLGTMLLGTGGVPLNGLFTFRHPRPSALGGNEWRTLIGIGYESTTLGQVARSTAKEWYGDLWFPSLALVYSSHKDVELPYWEMNPVERYFFEPLFSRGPTDTMPILEVAKFKKGFQLFAPLKFGAIMGMAKSVAPYLWSKRHEIYEAVSDAGSELASRVEDEMSGPDYVTKSAPTAGDAGPSSDAPPTLPPADDDGPMLLLTGDPGIGLPGLNLPEIPSLANMNLRVQLPPVSPEGAPDWFVSGDLYVEITGRPSFALGGTMTVKVQDDVLDFFVEGQIARDGLGASISITGGLESEAGWTSPFGVDWLTIRKAVLKLSVNTLGNVGLGFAGDVTVGTKDIEVAVALAVNAATGVPTNLVLYGESEEGVSLDDVVLLQQAIATAAGRAGPTIPLAMLPKVAVTDLRLQFAPKDEPQLGVEAGFGLSGALWIEPTRGAPLERVGEIDLAIDRAGVRGHGFIAGYGLGPLEWSDAEVFLVLSLSEQRLTISGSASIFGKTKTVRLELTGRGMLEDFLEAHGAALGLGIAAAKAKIADLKEAAKTKAQNVKNAVVTLKGKLPKLPKPVRPWKK